MKTNKSEHSPIKPDRIITVNIFNYLENLEKSKEKAKIE